MAFLAGFAASFSAAGQPSVQLSPGSLAFGESMGTTSLPRTVTVINAGNAPLNVNSVGLSSSEFTQANDCGTVQPGGSCAIHVTFKPSIAAGPLNATVPATATLTISSDSAGSPHAASLAGVGEKSLVSHFYHAILQREPDAEGKDFWQASSVRIAQLESGINETWYAMAMGFFMSPEYAALGRDDTGFVTDLYRTFFNRAPDSQGMSFWTGQLGTGMPREIVLASFLFSNEFVAFSQSIFGMDTARSEANTVTDFYRGLLARLPEDLGFANWAEQFRAVQCRAHQTAEFLSLADAISGQFMGGAEYTGRNRTNPQFVGDLYNAFLRRGGDLSGVQYWINRLDSAAETRDQVRQDFLSSPEFGQRLAGLDGDGCIDRATIADFGAGTLPQARTSPTDGFARVAFLVPAAPQSIVLGRCTDATCSAGPTNTTVQAVSAVGIGPQIGFSAQGLPVIAYLDANLHLLRCADETCATLASNVQVPLPRPTSTFEFTDNLGGTTASPIFVVNQDAIECFNPACTSHDTGVVGTHYDGTRRGGIVVGTDGLAVAASPWPNTQALLAVTRCGVTHFPCNFGSAGYLNEAGKVPTLTIAMRASNRAAIAYRLSRATTEFVKFVSCGDVTCNQNGNAETILDPALGAWSISMAIGADGAPVIAYQPIQPDGTVVPTIKVAKCGDANCASGNSVVTLAGVGVGYGNPSITIVNGLPFIAVDDTVNHRVKGISCKRAACN